MIAVPTENAMNTDAELGDCSREAELDRLICRMAAHGSYGASAAADGRKDRPAADGDEL